MDHLINVIRPYFEAWGYLIVFAVTLLENSAFLALLIPGDAVLLLAGFYAQRGALSLPAVMAIAFGGALLGDTIAYCVGRFAGRKVVDKWGGRRFLPERRIERFDRSALFLSLLSIGTYGGAMLAVLVGGGLAALGCTGHRSSLARAYFAAPSGTDGAGDRGLVCK